MEQFSNETINTATLPKFEDVQLTPLHPSYLKVVWLNLAIVYVIIALVAGAAFYFIEEVHPYWLPVVIGYLIILGFSVLISFINFRNRGFAFRTHDVISRSGAIAITTAIIPYNRVQHVAMHEGWLSRRLGLAAVEIFTAGGDKSDIKIPGIEKEHAENIKQLLMGKILKQDTDE